MRGKLNGVTKHYGLSPDRSGKPPSVKQEFHNEIFQAEVCEQTLNFSDVNILDILKLKSDFIGQKTDDMTKENLFSPKEFSTKQLFQTFFYQTTCCR